MNKLSKPSGSDNHRLPIPSLDRVLSHPSIVGHCHRMGRSRVKRWLQQQMDDWRTADKVPAWASEPESYGPILAAALRDQQYQSVFNLTGTLIHTNLGRAPLSEQLWREVGALVCGPANLEFELSSGKRGSRDRPVTDRLCALTGAEAACVVNNNAAALMLILNTLALGRQVPVSRGELIEIGGSFRLPEIMTQSGCRLREVGTTNRTHGSDFENAIDENTALLLQVHPSNYQVQGFTHSVSLAELVDLGRRHQLPTCVDLGSGSLVDLTRFGLPAEPTPQQLLAQGADLVCISGDKLLGSVQAGLIFGRQDLIDSLNLNPMKRALRLDKIALAYLERTLALYEAPDLLVQSLPLLQLLTVPLPELQQRGEHLQATINKVARELRPELMPSKCQIGSGAMPEERLDSLALVLNPRPASSEELLMSRLRTLPVPVIGRIHRGAVWLDLRGANPLDSLQRSLEALGEIR